MTPPAALERLWRDIEQRLNRPLLPREPESAFLDEWQAHTTAAALRQQRPDVLVTITTYRRPREVMALIDALSRELPALSNRSFVCVLSDRSDCVDDGAARQHLREHFGERSAWLDATRHMGKQRFWRTYQTIFSLARAAQPQQLLALQDDVEPVPGFAARLQRVWEATGATDPSRQVLYLFSSEDDEVDGRWIRFHREEMPGLPARRTDWFDLQGFVIDRAGLETLRYWVIPVPALRWRKDPTLSSGVGRQLTRRLFGRGAVYQCHPPLIGHGKAVSVMNPEARLRRPLDNQSLLRGDDPAG